MLFVHESPEVLWSDFSTLSGSERTTSLFESAFRFFMQKPNDFLKREIMINDNKYMIHFYPQNYTKKNHDTENFGIPTSYPDAIRHLFHINDPFVVITGKTRRISNQTDAQLLLSLIAPAAQSSEFYFPVFINITFKSCLNYTGVWYANNKVTHFYSYFVDSTEVDFFAIEEEEEEEVNFLFESFPRCLNFFRKNFLSPYSIEFNGRDQIELRSEQFKSNANYNYKCFYSDVSKDPIFGLRINFNWDKILLSSGNNNTNNLNSNVNKNRSKNNKNEIKNENDNKNEDQNENENENENDNKKVYEFFEPILSNAKQLKISVEYKMAYSHQTPMHSFVKRLSSIKKNDSFKIWTSQSNLNEADYLIYIQIIEDLFKINKNPQRKKVEDIKIKEKNSFFKSAPQNSILEKFAIKIAENKTIGNFVILWKMFIQHIRMNYCEKKVPIPNIDFKNFDYSNCLIYQHLQLIANFLSEDSKFLFSEDQFEEEKKFFLKNEKNEILEELMLSFKNMNKNSTFSDFLNILPEIKSKQIEAYEKIWNSLAKSNEFRHLFEQRIEFSLDYLDGLNPSEVYIQIVRVMFDAAFRDISKRVPIEIPFASNAFNSIKKVFEEFDKNESENVDSLINICRTIEENTLKIELINSGLTKIPSAEKVNELFEKGYCTIDASGNDKYAFELIEAMNMDRSIDKMINSQYLFTGKSGFKKGEATQYLFISKKMDSGNEIYNIASAIQEIL